MVGAQKKLPGHACLRSTNPLHVLPLNRKRVGALAAMTQNCCATCVRIRTYDPQAYDMSQHKDLHIEVFECHVRTGHESSHQSELVLV